MARPLRIEIPDGLFHVTSRGTERRAILLDDADRAKWVELLDRVVTRRRWVVLAWTLMDNHFHLFLRTPQPNLSAGMHDLNSGYVSAFNRRHDRCGPLLQGRFKAILVEREFHYWELSRYVHLNPVRAGLVERPEDHRWGSCASYLGRAPAPEWLRWEEVLGQHGRTLRTARREYARFLAEGVTSPPESPLRGVVATVLLGSQAFVERVRSWLSERLPDRDVPAARELKKAPRVEEIDAAVSRAFAIPAESLHVRGKWHNEARGAAIYLCRKLTGHSIRELGERYGGVGGQAIGRTAILTAQRLRSERHLAKLVRNCEEHLKGEQIES